MQINLDLNKKDTILSDLTFYSYPKQLDAMMHIYTTSQKFLNSKIFNVFFLRILFCSPSLHLFDPIHSKSSNTVK